MTLGTASTCPVLGNFPWPVCFHQGWEDIPGARGPEPALERADFSLATDSPEEWLSLSTLTPFLLLLALLGPDTEHKGAPESHPKG